MHLRGIFYSVRKSFVVMKMCVIIVSRMGKIAKYLNQLIVGNVYDTPDILDAYSTDRSVLKIKPKAVALPESTEDVCKLMQFCYQLAKKDIKVPVTVRGSGLDESGADLGNGVIISTEKLNRLLESDKRERLVRVQAGITLKELNTALSINGLTIPVSGHEMETIGGLISNCPLDAGAGRYGGIFSFVERVEFVLPNGDIIQTNRINEHGITKIAGEKSKEGEIYEKLKQIIKTNEVLIREIEKTGHSSYGYPMIAQASKGESIDLMPLLFKAQGTLGVITEVILRAVPMEGKVSRVVVTAEKFETAQKFLELATTMNPRELNIYDIRIAKAVEETGKKLGQITKQAKEGFVVMAKFDQNKKNLKKIASMESVLPKGSQLIIESDKTREAIDEFSNSLVSFLNQIRVGERVPIVTDFYIPPENLANFLNDLAVMEKSLGLELALFGSFATGNYSLRPKFDVEAEDFSKKAVAFLRAGNFVIQRQGGSITGGSPEGRIKAIVTNDGMPEFEKNLYLDIRNIFDDCEIMNPSVKLGTDTRYTLDHFRTTSSVISVL